MGNVIIPKHTAELVYFDSAMKILSDAKDWILMGDFTDSLFKHLKAIGKEQTRHSDNTHYTKCAQLPLYFGFAERNVVSGKTYLRITFTGQAFYDASKRGDFSSMHLLLLESLEHGLFGEENDGVPSSRSDVDAPNLFVRASYDLEGLSNKEFAYILWSLVDKNDDYTGSVNQIRKFRKKGVWNLPSNATNYQDCKPIMILNRWNFLTQGSNGLAVNPKLDTLYHDRFVNLKIYSVDRNINHGTKILTLRYRPLTEPIQLITYGAPGTGKSDGIERKMRENHIEPIRTTFHPDSDYQSFVGAYKPFMKKIQRVVYVNDGKTAQLVTGPDELKDEEVISYEFRPQSFTKAYVKAWEAMVAGEAKPVVLVIEEINRGDCAKIFGDLFQLLDRDDKTGFSRYPIVADHDLRDYLEKTFGTPAFQACASVEGIDAGVWSDVKVGKKLVLPPNLYIWATMNTSDQSLFPMDSAFKRRWEWKYVPIKNHKDEGWTIDVSGSKKYDWWDFLQKVNKHIFDLTNSEDKQLGYFFVKAKDKVVSLDVFVNKVVFYLWNAVFKDCYTECDFLKDGSSYLIFTKFFDDEGNAKADVVQKFLDALKVDPPKVNENVGTPGGTPQTSSGGQPAVDGESQQSDATVGNEEVQG